jgi:hypothetical protein
VWCPRNSAEAVEGTPSRSGPVIWRGVPGTRSGPVIWCGVSGTNLRSDPKPVRAGIAMIWLLKGASIRASQSTILCTYWGYFWGAQYAQYVHSMLLDDGITGAVSSIQPRLTLSVRSGVGINPLFSGFERGGKLGTQTAHSTHIARRLALPFNQ